MGNRISLLAAALLAGTITPCAEAQQPACPSQTVLVSVVDQKGELVRDLSVENFRGTFRRKPVAIKSARWISAVPRVVIVVDTSGTMIAQSRWKMAKQLALGLVNELPDPASVAIVTFGDEITRLVGFRTGKSHAISALQEMRRDDFRKVGVGKASLFEAIYEANAMLRPRKRGDAIYIITDGGKNGSRRRRYEVLTELRKSGTRLFASGLSYRPLEAIGDMYVAATDLLGPFAQTTGGELVTTRFEQDYARGFGELTLEQLTSLGEVARRLSKHVAQYYEAEIELPRAVDRPRDWKLDVVGPDGKRRRDVVISYPRRLMPCSTPASR